MTRWFRGAPLDGFDICGLSLFVWLEMYDHYRRSNQWPDGGPLLSQPSVAVHVFRVIEHQIEREERNGQRS